MPLELTPWGKFVNEYGVMVPRWLWNQIRKNAQELMDYEQDWEFFLGELAAGCKELSENERLCEIICMEEEMEDTPSD